MITLTSAADVQRGENVSMLIYGAPGMGKTSVVKYLPGKTLMLDVDGTSLVLAGEKDIDVAKIDPAKAHKSMTEFFMFAKEHNEEYDNVVIDNLTHYEKLWFKERAKRTKSGQPEIKDYAIYNNHMIDLITLFNQLEGIKVYTAWETTKEVQLESGQLYHTFYPELRDSIRSSLMGIVPIVGRILRNPTTKKRGILLQQSDGTYAKNQIDNREFCLQEDLFTFGDVVVKDDEEE